MLYLGPYVLEGGAQLDLEAVLVHVGMGGVTVEGARNPADVVQGEVPEAIGVEHGTLVDGVLPVDLEGRLDEPGDAVDVIGIVGNHASAEDIGDVGERMVLLPLDLELARQALLGLDAGGHGIRHQAALEDHLPELRDRDIPHDLVVGQGLPVLAENRLAMRIHSTTSLLNGLAMAYPLAWVPISR